MNLNFGHWLKTNRTQRGLSIKELANTSGIGTGTISRIENDASSPNMGTTIRLLQGLGISLPDLGRAFPELHISDFLLQTLDNPHPELLSIYDVEAFVNICYRDPQSGIEIFVSLLNNVYVSSQASGIGGDFGQGPFSVQDLERLRPPFVAQDFYKLLFAHPLYQYEIHYPMGLTSETIKKIFLNGGALSFEDIGAYIRKLREEKNIPFRELDLPTKISASDLSRFETGSVSKIKLEDVLSLDQALGKDGVIFAMYWQSDKLYSLQFQRNNVDAGNAKSGEWTKQEIALVSGFIKVARWLSFYNPSQGWLVNFRHRVLDG